MDRFSNGKIRRLKQGRATYGPRAGSCPRRDFDWPADCFWTTEVGKKAVCLLCSESVAVLKEYNISCHYAAMAVLYQQRNGKLVRQQNVFGKAKVAQKAATHANIQHC